MKIKKRSLLLKHCGRPMAIGVTEYEDGDRATHATCLVCRQLSLIHIGKWEDETDWPVLEQDLKSPRN